MGQAWSPEDIKRLDTMVRAGASVPELCEAFSRTRWAIIGKTRQMNLSVSKVTKGRRAPVINAPWTQPRQAPTPPPPFRMTAKEKHFARMVPVLSEDHRPWESRQIGECAAPVTMDNGAIHSCCQPVFTPRGKRTPSSYCREHHRIFFLPVKAGPRDMARATHRLRP